MHGGFHLTDTFWQFVKDRNVSSLDLSYNMIMDFNRTAFTENCDSLTEISFQGSDLFWLSGDASPSPKPCGSLRFLDISEITLPKLVQSICQITIPIENYFPIKILIKKVIDFRNVETVLFNQFCNERSTIVLRNITIVKEDIECNVRWKNVSLNGVGLKELDIQMDKNLCFDNNHTTLSLNGNIMEFINPSVIHSMGKLDTVDLSYNNFAYMMTHNTSLFEILFLSKTLKYINLSYNKITHLSHNVFSQCIYLQTLNLSGNYLEDIEFHINQTLTMLILDILRSIF
ncbi:hypothetical protein DPMN_089050 [Dreissena polymorpha]|uniref:Toll-like receptor n=1 Tax=Dreissena polymorpha TaxID=45954 RepID=A0A9D4KX21_DREPO|nr:hypothetical protein DPMN_089050 [Dreissena polymorpha]